MRTEHNALTLSQPKVVKLAKIRDLIESKLIVWQFSYASLSNALIRCCSQLNDLVVLDIRADKEGITRKRQNYI